MDEIEQLLRAAREMQRSGEAVPTGLMERINDLQKRNFSKELRYLPIMPPNLSSMRIQDWLVDGNGFITTNASTTSRSALDEAQAKIVELTEILDRVQKEPLILFTIDRISKDKKHAYVKKNETEVRIEACPKLQSGDEVLLHPKTMQIVEHLGKPPLEVSRFAPDNIPNVLWDEIGGLEDAKADLIEAVELPHQNKEIFKFYGQKQIKGILLAGPPGCGKTMLGKATATALSKIYGKEKARTGFLYIKGPEILNQYVGNSEQTIRDMFYDAKRHKEEHGYPAVIFLDEADAILATRGTRSVGIGNTIVPQFLTEMDGLEESSAIVIIATNRPDVLDPAIVRDGRIDRKVIVTRPNEDNAREILKLNLKKTPLVGSVSEDNTKLVEYTVGKLVEYVYSINCSLRQGVYLRDIVNGAMLANIVNIAVGVAIKRDLANKKTKKGSGVALEDLTTAVDRILVQSRHIVHDLGVAA